MVCCNATVPPPVALPFSGVSRVGRRFREDLPRPRRAEHLLGVASDQVTNVLGDPEPLGASRLLRERVLAAIHPNEQRKCSVHR